MAHIEEAVAALNSASEQMPVGMVMELSQRLSSVAQYAAQAGGYGEQLAQETFALQGQVETFAGQMAVLQGKLRNTAMQILSAGSA